jgi:site-specific recombinase XerD
MTSKALTTTRSTSINVYTESARKYARQSKAPHTLAMYGSAWREFQHFAELRGVAALPATPGAVIDFLTSLADNGAKVSTIQVKLAAIAYYHRQQKATDPTTDEDVKIVMAGIRRKLGTAPDKKAPIMLDELRRIVAALPDTLAGKRDRAMLLIGWAGAFRRSELVGLDVADLHVNGKLTIKIKRSKTDQEGKGLTKVIPPIDDEAIDPMTALKVWLAASEIKRGPLFRRIDKWGVMHDGRLNDRTVANVVKGAAQRAGLESVQFAGHSLRSGFITEAANAGVESRDIMAQTGHKSEAVMRGYVQDAGRGAMGAVRAAFGEKQSK